MAEIDLKKIHRTTRKELGEFGAEVESLKRLRDSLQDIAAGKGDLKSNIREANRIVGTYVGRTEQYSARKEKRFIEDFQNLVNALKGDKKEEKGKKLMTQILVADRTLVAASSRYTGKLRDAVRKSLASIQAGGKKELVRPALERVENTLKWALGMQAALALADRFIAEIQAWLKAA